MRYALIIAALLAAFNASAQFVRGAGVGYTSGAPNHNPGALGSPQAIDTITGYWYQYEYGAGTWRQAGFWLQPTNAAGAPSYTPAKQRQLFAINSGDSIYYYRSGAWRLLNGPPVAGTNIDVSGRTISLDTLGLVLFKTDQSYADGVGSFGWDADAETFTLGLTTDVKLQLGQETHYHVLNDTAATLLNGRVVRGTGTTGNSGKLKARYFTASGAVHGRYVLGVVTADITQGSEGYVTHFGLVRGINASGSPYGESWADGDVLYAHPTIAGGLTKTEPTSPNEKVVVAMVVSNSSTVGSIFVRPQFPWDLGELGNVNISNPTNGQALTYNSATGIWENSSSAAGISYSDTTSLIATQHYVNSRGFLTAEVDGSTTNEIQLIDTLSIVSDSLRVSLNNNGAAYSAVALGAYRQTIDTFSRSGRTVSLSLSGDNQPAQTITLAADSTTILTQDSILSYRAGGVEYARDTITGLSGGGGAGLSGGVADYLVQWTGASTVDTSGVIWTGGRLGVRETSPSATLNVKGAGSTSATTALLVENSGDVAKLVVKDDGAIEVGRNATGTTEETASITVTGSETNIGLALVPKGDGAITADIPNAAASGGNARGAYAVDLQMERTAATQIASGSNSVISGGTLNTASNTASIVCGGYGNAATGTYSLATSGFANISSGSYSTVLNGLYSTASTSYSVASGARSNAYLIGMHTTNSGTFGGSGSQASSDAQTSHIRMWRQITGTSASSLLIDGAGNTAILNLPAGASNGRIWNAKIQLTAICTVQGNGTVTVGESLIGNYAVGIKRIGNTTSLVGTVQTLHTTQSDTNMASSTVTIDADDTNEALSIQFTPPTAAGSTTVIRVLATVYLTEVGY